MKSSLKIQLFLWVSGIILFSTLVNYVVYRGNFLSENIILGVSLLFIASLIATYFIYQYFKKLVNTAAQLMAHKDTLNPSIKDGIKGSEEIFEEIFDQSSQVENKLAFYTEQTNQFSSVLSKMGQGVILINKDLKVLFLNKTINTEFFSELKIGDNLFENISYPLFKKFIEKAWDKKDLIREISGPKSVKTVYLVSAKKDIFRDEMLIVFSDISKMKNMEKMREDFIGNVSHELRTPISVIKANAETLIEGGLLKDDENAKIFTKAIFSQSERMTDIVNDLLKITSMEAGEYPISVESLAPHKIIEELSQEHDQIIKDNQLEIKNLVYENSKVFADRPALKLILTNFLSNAIKHSPNKSKIIFEESKPSLDILRVSVADSGKGVPKKYKDRVFERFYRIDKGRSIDKGGSGLGLSICKNLALMMGYSVGVESNDPKGSIFFIDIKLDNSKSKEVA